jgi:uncharacterized protein (TIGR00106 family)
MAMMEISVSPRGAPTLSLSTYVARALRALGTTDLSHQTHAMGTIIEGPVDQLFKVAELMHEACFGDEIQRVVTAIKIDDRRDISRNMAEKLDSLESKL